MLTFFGLMDGEHIGIAHTPAVAAGYGIVAVVLLVCEKCLKTVPATQEDHDHIPKGGINELAPVS